MIYLFMTEKGCKEIRYLRICIAVRQYRYIQKRDSLNKVESCDNIDTTNECSSQERDDSIFQERESNLQDGYVEQCIRDDDYTNYPFKCTIAGSTSYFVRDAALPGTNCILDGVKDPSNVSPCHQIYLINTTFMQPFHSSQY